MGQDRRKRTRVEFKFETLVTVDNQEVRVNSHNLSLKGILCSSDSIFQADQLCKVTLNLTPESEGEVIQATIHGRIIRTNPIETAIEFTLMDAESFFHLKNIVECHSREPERIAQELLTAAFLPPAK
ncbi:MAG: PilZ domain-containing protein [Desulfobaccales bacterium]